jgi:hypothetical protein
MIFGDDGSSFKFINILIWMGGLHSNLRAWESLHPWVWFLHWYWSSWRNSPLGVLACREFIVVQFFPRFLSFSPLHNSIWCRFIISIHNLLILFIPWGRFNVDPLIGLDFVWHSSLEMCLSSPSAAALASWISFLHFSLCLSFCSSVMLHHLGHWCLEFLKELEPDAVLNWFVVNLGDPVDCNVGCENGFDARINDFDLYKDENFDRDSLVCDTCDELLSHDSNVAGLKMQMELVWVDLVSTQRLVHFVFWQMAHFLTAMQPLQLNWY